MNWFLAAAGFAALIMLHEFGHFVVAKAVGMRVERFALFFPPLILKFRRGETEYGLGSIPLGGYVRITGMNPEEEIPPEVEHRAYYRQPVWRRIAVIAAGPVMNVLTALVLMVGFFWLAGEVTASTEVRAIRSGSPVAGQLRPGDRLLAVDGVRGAAAELSTRIASHGCAARPPKAGCVSAEPARLLIRRGERELTFVVSPRYDASLSRMRLGFEFDRARERMSLFGAIGRSASETWRISRDIIALPVRLFDSRKRDELSSVVGGYEATRQTLNYDSPSAIGLLAVISLSLAIINLFPFLPLDGGHIFWALVEKARRRPVSFRVMEKASVVGFMLVLMLFAIGLSNDIERLQGPGFLPR